MQAKKCSETQAKLPEATLCDEEFEVSVTTSWHELTAAPAALDVPTSTSLQRLGLGLGSEDALELLQLHGPNTLPNSKAPILAVTTGVWAAGAGALSLMVCITAALHWRDWTTTLPVLGFALGEASIR